MKTQVLLFEILKSTECRRAFWLCHLDSESILTPLGMITLSFSPKGTKHRSAYPMHLYFRGCFLPTPQTAWIRLSFNQCISLLGLGGLNNKKLFPHSSEDQKSMFSVPDDLLSGEALFLAGRQLPSCYPHLAFSEYIHTGERERREVGRWGLGGGGVESASSLVFVLLRALILSVQHPPPLWPRLTFITSLEARSRVGL